MELDLKTSVERFKGLTQRNTDLDAEATRPSDTFSLGPMWDSKFIGDF